MSLTVLTQPLTAAVLPLPAGTQEKSPPLPGADRLPPPVLPSAPALDRRRFLRTPARPPVRE
jgi:hypothetical protein